MNAKETLQKIAEALNIASSEPKEVSVDETQVEVTPVVETEVKEEVKEEAPVEEVKSAEAVETAEAVEVKEEATEEPTVKEEASEKVEVSKDSERVAEMQKQIEDLKAILQNALSQPEEEKVEAPQVKNEPKGLTHSPEKPVQTKANGIGNKGSSIKDRVFKYISNN